MQEQTVETPLYAKVHAALRHAIRGGRLAAGAVLPSEKELELEHGVSRITVRRALMELEHEGLVVRGQGRQARVVEPLVSTAHGHIDDDLAAMLDLGHGTESKILGFHWQLPDESVSAKLEIDGTEPVLVVERLRMKAGRPILHTQAVVPAWIGTKFDRESLGRQTMIDQLARSGVTITEAVQSMYAAPCPETVAPLIGISGGDPCFIIERLVRDGKRRPVQHLLAIFRWDCFTYRISSTRSESGRRVEMAGAGRMGISD